MKTLEPDQLNRISVVARSLRDDPCDVTSLHAAADMIADGLGRPLFEALLDARRDGDDEDAAIRGTMSTLEKMMDANPGVAGYFMARLHPVAERRYLHATRDGIELWMWNNTSRDVADSLMKVAQEGVRPRLRKSLERWAAKIRTSTS